MDVFENRLFYNDLDSGYFNATGSNNLIDSAKSKFKISDNIVALSNNITEMEKLIKTYTIELSRLAPYNYQNPALNSLNDTLRKRYNDAISFLKNLINEHKNQISKLQDIIKKQQEAQSNAPSGGTTTGGTTTGGTTTGGTTSGGTTSGGATGGGTTGLTDSNNIEDKKPFNKKLLLYGGIGVGVLLLVVLLVRRNG